MKINKITPLPLEIGPEKKRTNKPMILLVAILALVVISLWMLWPTILLESIHFQKVSLDYLTEQFYSENSYAALIILGVCFIYGILHSLGPGHGKVVVTTYLSTNHTQLKAGIFITLCSAIMQGLVAVTLVTVFVFLFHQTMRTLNATVTEFYTYSGVLIVILGAQLIFRAVKRLYQTNQQHDCGCSCGHKHTADAEELNTMSTPREYLMIILGIGLRPCSGAILVLFFAHLADMYWLGVVGAFFMSIGTAITTSLIAFLTVSGRKIIQYYLRQSPSKMGQLWPTLAKSLAGMFLIVIGILLIVVPTYGMSPILS